MNIRMNQIQPYYNNWNTQFYIMYKEKVDDLNAFMIINHIHMILHAFPNIKKYRPKYIFYKEYEYKLNKMFEYPPALKTRNRDKTLNVSM